MLRKTLNSEIMKNSLGRVRVAKKKFGSGSGYSSDPAGWIFINSTDHHRRIILGSTSELLVIAHGKQDNGCFLGGLVFALNFVS